jgi:asparagine synthase (glutamine-hydrolysing)
MCGFVGYQVPEGAPIPGEEALARALGRLRHRGPDGEGAWFSPDRRVGLAHARLAVIDPDGGAQPMVDPGTGAVVVTNGEIYNFRELVPGYAPRTRSDTEPLLRGFARDGEAILPRLRGMFAFAAWRPAENRVLLVRDRLGQKPLFHTALPGGGLAFASELPALLELADRPVTPDDHALALYLSLGYFPAPFTAYRGVRKLPAGSLLRFGESEAERWWRRPAPDRADGADLRELIRDAVRARLVADVPVGAFLSGGLDSATVVAFMAEESSAPVRTFTVESPHPEYDESEVAAEVAERFGTVHERIRIDPPAVEEIPEILGRFGEPFGDSSVLATALVSRAAREHVTVALTGDGGDEAFGGYDRFAILAGLDRIPRAAARMFARTLRGRPRRALDLAAMEPWRRYCEFYESFNGGAREELLSPRLSALHLDATAEWMRELYTAYPGTELDRMLAVDQATWLPDDLNHKVDMASMAVALECRSPLQDHLLVEACAAIPADRHVRGRKKKALLREAVGDLLPERVLTGKKMGFAAPVEHWFTGDLEGFLTSKLRSPALRDLDLVRPEAVEQVIRSLETGRATGKPRIQAFILLALAIWAENLS